jgi:hypothetical protein
MNRNEMEELLPDYAFGRLEKEAAEVYTKHLEEYPDLQKEIADIQEVFSRVEKMDFDSILERRTRNLSVKVNNRRTIRKPLLSGNAFLIRFGIPAVVVMAIMIALFNGTGEKNYTDETKTFSQKLNSALNFDDIDEDSYSDYEYLGTTIPASNDNNQDLVGSQILNELYTDDLDEKKAMLKVVSMNITSSNVFLDELEELSEEEFQLLLEEIKNVQI